MLPPPVQAWLRACWRGSLARCARPPRPSNCGDSESLQFSFIGQVGHDELLLRVVA